MTYTFAFLLGFSIGPVLLGMVAIFIHALVLGITKISNWVDARLG